MEKYTQLAANGPVFSKVVVGAWKWGAEAKGLKVKDVDALVRSCLDLEVTTFDHADIYGHFENEALFGQVLKAEPSLRKQMQLVSKTGIRMVSHNRPNHKVPSYDTSKDYILQQAHQSLKNLSTDYLDVLLIHRPDPLMDPDEMAEAFEHLHRQGAVRYFGVSNFTPSQFSMLYSRYPLVTNQVEISILETSTLFDGTLDQCQEYGVAPMAWSPLGGGSLFAADGAEKVKRVQEVAKPLCEKYGLGLDQLLLAWLALHPASIVPVLGTVKPERVSAAQNAMQVALEKQDWFALLRASRGYDVP